MNCFQCNLMFSIKRKKFTYECGYSFCEACLLITRENIPQDCPIKDHHKCKLIKEKGNTDYIKNELDKKVKVVFIGSKGAGKTSLIRSMNDQQPKKTNHTISIDVISVHRRVKNFNVQFNLWDTVSQSSLFQGFDTTFKRSDVQIIVTMQENAERIKEFFDYVEQNTQKPHIIIVQNKKNEHYLDRSSELKKLLYGKKYQIVTIDCRNRNDAGLIWALLDSDSLTLKQSQSKLVGNTIIRLKNEEQTNDFGCQC